MTTDQLARFVAKLRFAELDEDLGECWLWTASLMPNGYAQFNRGKGSKLAHRASYEHFVGDIESGSEIDHLCRARACVNPRHLEPVLHATNLERSYRSKSVETRAKMAEARRLWWQRRREQVA